jgi:hypothetical protein
MILLLPLLLAATLPSEPSMQMKRPAVQLTTATVQILAAERVDPALVQKSRPDRQVRRRKDELLVEFN